MAGWCSAVGWNCTNSTSAVGTPARSAMATPSPVDSAGLVVTEYSCPAPPVASTTLAARMATGAGPAPASWGGSAVTPTLRPPSVIRSTANQPSRTALAERYVASTSARSTSAPVAAPPAWTTRGREWPPSRASESEPVVSRSNTAPSAMSSCTRPGPSSTRMRTASSSHRPAPARQRVGQMQVGRILVGTEHGGHAALGPPRGGLGECALGQDAEGERLTRRRDGSGEADGGGQAGDAAAQDQDVERSGGRPGAHAGSVSGAESSASRRAETSSITRLRPSTCTTRGT